MPLYEYACQNCRQDFELLVRGSQQPECPNCGAKQLRKLMSAPAAPSSASRTLPVSEAPAGGCGMPQCGGGQCAFE